MQKIIFLSGGWMSFYEGITHRDNEIVGGGRYIKENGFGGEVYNFQNSQGKCYGYVMTKSGTLNLNRITGQKTNNEICENVICVFVATHPNGEGRRIVGWYTNATIYSNYQKYDGRDRKIESDLVDWPPNSDQVGYLVSAKSEFVTLLTADERLSAPKVPGGKGGFGQSNVWYADSPEGLEFCDKTIEFITHYIKQYKLSHQNEGKRIASIRSSMEVKKKVEEIAIVQTSRYFENLGYVCKSVEVENKGWDLECSLGKTNLLVEVKGLSQPDISVLLTRNEYLKMGENRLYYRLAVVTNCVSKDVTPSLNIFSYVQEKNGWFDQYANELVIDEVISARCKCENTVSGKEV